MTSHVGFIYHQKSLVRSRADPINSSQAKPYKKSHPKLAQDDSDRVYVLEVLLLLILLLPAVLEGDDTVEHRFFCGGIRVTGEIAKAQELEILAGFCLIQGRFTPGSDDLQGIVVGNRGRSFLLPLPWDRAP